MLGEDASSRGVIPNLNEDLFKRISSSKKNVAFLVTVSYLEIYNEELRDLLRPSSSPQKLLRIREHPDAGIYVEGLSEVVVKNEKELRDLLNRGNKVRKIAETSMNMRSSRSHTCFTICVEQKQLSDLPDMANRLTAKINLVDLAGSERVAKTGAVGDRLKEGAYINKSLSCLGNVINALSKPTPCTPGPHHEKHIPYRDSKLTRLLQESLGGNSLTAMIATVSPCEKNYYETVSTLKYANRAKNIRNEAKVNEDMNSKIIRELRREIARLRRKANTTTNTTTTTTTQDDIDAIYRKNRALQSEWEMLHAERSRLLDRYQEILQNNEEDENLERDLEDVGERLSKTTAEAAACGLFLDHRNNSDDQKQFTIEIVEELERVRNDAAQLKARLRSDGRGTTIELKLADERARRQCAEIERAAYEAKCRDLQVSLRAEKRKYASVMDQNEGSRLKRLCSVLEKEKASLTNVCEAMTTQLQYSLKRILELQRLNSPRSSSSPISETKLGCETKLF